MPLDPQLQAYFAQNRGAAPPQPPRRQLDPQLAEYFRQSHAQNVRAQPPPVVVPQPAPAPPPAPIQVAAPAPPAPPEPSLLDKAGAIFGHVTKPISILGFDQANAALNAGVDEGLRAEAEGGPLAGFVGFFRGLVTKGPQAALAASDPRTPSVAPHWISEPLKAEGAHPLAAEGLQFLASTLLFDPPVAKLSGGLMGLLGKGVARRSQASGLLDAAIPGVGRSANELREAARLRNVAKQALVRGDAMAGIQRRKADQSIREVTDYYTKIQRERGVDFSRPAQGGRRVNVADEWATHWLEAGSPGAKYPDRSVVERLAQADGVTGQDLQFVAGKVRDRFGEVGRWLEEVGFLKPGTVDRFGDQYIARVYHFASHNLDDIEAALAEGVKGGWLTPEAEALAQKVTRSAGLGRGTGFTPGKARRVTDAGLAEGLGREYQAGVSLANALPKQARIGARFQAVKEIADNPELFISAVKKEARPGLSADRLAQVEHRADQAERAYRMADTDLNFLKDALPRAPRSEREAIRLKIQLQIRKVRDLKATAARRAEDLKSAGARFDRGPTQANVASGAAKPPGWTKANIGGREGYWHPEALGVIENVDKFATLDNIAAMRTLAKASKFIRGRWVAWNPAVQAGNIKQNIILSEGAAAAAGVHWNPSMVVQDGNELRNALKSPNGNPLFNELAKRSRALTGDSGQLGEVGRSLRSNIGIDRPIDKLVKGVKAFDAAPGEAFSFVEKAFKYSLFKRLVKGGKSFDEAAAIVDRALFDHADQHAIALMFQKYGAIPFMGSRLKGLENTLGIMARNPDILIRQSGLRLAQALHAGTGAEGPLEDPKTGKLNFPGVPGWAASGQLLSQNPLQAIDPSVDPFKNPLGVFQPAWNAVYNQDPFKREVFPEGGGFIVRPGELPPMDALIERAKYAAEAYAPFGVLTPGIGRGAKRLDRAQQGTTQYGGPTQEPETPMQALLGVFAGIKVQRQEGDRQKSLRGRGVMQDRLANQVFLAQYKSEVRSGRAKRQEWPAHMLPKDPRTTQAWAKNAASKLRSYIFGGEDVQGSQEQQAKIRHLADWLMALEDHQRETFQQRLSLDDLRD